MRTPSSRWDRSGRPADRFQQPGRDRSGAVERPTEDPEVRSCPAVHPELDERSAVRRQGGSPDHRRARRRDGPGAATGRVDERERRPTPIVRSRRAPVHRTVRPRRTPTPGPAADWPCCPGPPRASRCPVESPAGQSRVQPPPGPRSSGLASSRRVRGAGRRIPGPVAGAQRRRGDRPRRRPAPPIPGRSDAPISYPPWSDDLLRRMCGGGRRARRPCVGTATSPALIRAERAPIGPDGARCATLPTDIRQRRVVAKPVRIRHSPATVNAPSGAEVRSPTPRCMLEPSRER